MNQRQSLQQFFTPAWLAEALVERFFHDLGPGDAVIEPSCGEGAFLAAIPPAVSALGVEIDPEAAERARRFTGRPVVTGDFLTVEIDFQPTAFIGNPPFRLKTVEGTLARARSMLPDGGRVGLLLPTYHFQNALHVTRYSAGWIVRYELVARNAFNERMRSPLLFALFQKAREGALIGFALYHEAADVLHMSVRYREALRSTVGSLWRAVCRVALQHLGGRATLSEIYGELEGNRPTSTRFWREKIRQTLQVYPEFQPVTVGEWRLA